MTMRRIYPFSSHGTVNLLARYGLAIVAIALSALLRWMMPDVLSRAPYLGFYPAVVAAAILGGLGPGMVATFGSLLLVNLVFIQFDILDYGLQMRNVIWIIGGAGVSVLADMQRAARLRHLQQREWLAVTLSSIGDAVLATDTTGKITFINPVAEALTGWREQEALGRSVQDVFRIINEQTRQPADDIVARVLREGCAVALANHTAIQTRDGREVPIEDSAAPIKDAKGKMTGVVLVFHDVTQKRRAQEMLATSENRLRRFYESGLLGVIYWNMNGHITDANDKFLEMVGYNREDLVAGRIDWDGMTPPEYRHLDELSVAELKATGANKAPFEKAYICKNGTRLPILIAGAMLDEARFNGVAFVMDIAERKRAEEALHDSESRRKVAEAVEVERKRLFDVLETLPAMICLLTQDYHVAFANRAFRERFGESHGRHCYDYCFGRSTPCEFCESYNVLKTGQPHHWEVNSPDGSVIDAYDFPFTDSDGSPMILEMDIDITEVKKAQAALKEANDTLEQRVAERTAELARSNKELEQFAYISAHDLQEPLRQVRAFVQILRDRHADKFEGKAAEYFQFVYDGAARMSALVRGLLDYSRADAKDRPREPVSCQKVLDTVLADLQASIAESHARIAHDELPTVTAESGQLTQLFQNLIANAIKFRRDGVTPEIHVGCRRDHDGWLFSVKDNGIGIDPEHYDKVFVIFQRLHGPQKYGGTGIGLAICKKIVEQYRGKIWIESKAGEGSTFYFTLPETKS